MPAELPLSPARALRVALVLVLTLGLLGATSALERREASAATASQVLAEAATHAGKPYRYGATGPHAFDCSGFTGYVFRQVGISLPRTSGAQRAALPRIPNEQKQPGDLIFTHDRGGRVYHVGIYAGGGMIWHSPRSGDVVKHSPIFGTYTVGRPPLAPPPPPATPIQRHWDANPGLRAALGDPVTPEFAVAGGTVRNFRHGQILHSPATGAKAVLGEIHELYGRLRWEQGPLGFPVTDEVALPGGGRQTVFQYGVIVYSPAGGARLVHGQVRKQFEALGGVNGPLGYPDGDRREVPSGVAQSFTGGEMLVDTATKQATALLGEQVEAFRAAGKL